MKHKTRILYRPYGDGSVSVRIEGEHKADVAAEVKIIMDKADKLGGLASFYGPLRISAGYVATGNYRIEQWGSD